MENTIYDMAGFTSPDFRSEENRVKMVYALLTSNEFYHQELAVVNPTPTQYHPDYVAPRDLAVYYYCADNAEAVPGLENLQRLMGEYQSPIICTASHNPEMDRSFQVVCLPDHNKTSDASGVDLLFIHFTAPMSIEAKKKIGSQLMCAYNAL